MLRGGGTRVRRRHDRRQHSDDCDDCGDCDDCYGLDDCDDLTDCDDCRDQVSTWQARGAPRLQRKIAIITMTAMTAIIVVTAMTAMIAMNLTIAMSRDVACKGERGGVWRGGSTHAREAAPRQA